MPEVTHAAAAERDEIRPAVAPRGDETMLLAEDDSGVRNLALQMLENMGYRVLAAEGPDPALAQAAACDGPIHLLITDVVMPGMGGRRKAAPRSCRALLAAGPGAQGAGSPERGVTAGWFLDAHPTG